MPKLLYRGSIALTVVVVTLFSSRPADAQISNDPGPPREPGGLVNNLATGVWYDVVNQAKAERLLQIREAKLRHDTERGHPAAVHREVRRIDNLRYRIVVDEWLIRKNLLQDPGCYPYPLRMDPISCAALANVRRPEEFPTIPQSAATQRPMVVPTTNYPSVAPIPGPMSALAITIVNAQPNGVGVNFAIDGIPHQIVGGSRLDLSVLPDSNITYDGGGSLGQREYRISPGLYEFRSTTEGLALYRLADKPS